MVIFVYLHYGLTLGNGVGVSICRQSEQILHQLRFPTSISARDKSKLFIVMFWDPDVEDGLVIQEIFYKELVSIIIFGSILIGSELTPEYSSF